MDYIIAFLKKVKPFDILTNAVLIDVATQLEKLEYTSGTFIYRQETNKMRGIEIIVEGGYESFFYDSNQQKRLVESHGPGFCFGGISILMNERKSLRTVMANQKTTVWFLHHKYFRALCQQYSEFFQHFTTEFGRRMLNDEFAHFVKHPLSYEISYTASEQMYTRKLEQVERRILITCKSCTPVYEAARIMAREKISCLFVIDGDEKIIGYITDITLRNNVLARLGDPHNAVEKIMDNPLVTIDSQAYVYEAILLMFRTRTRYLLIEKNGRISGFISRNKLLSEQAHSPFVFIQSVRLSNTINDLKNKWEKVPEIITQLLARGVKPEIVNQIITTVADTIAQKIIEQAIEEQGPPPAKFAFIVLGSEGRKEQTLKTDQDNAIIYEDKANEHREQVREYFIKLAETVSDRLNTTGFSYCTGGFMASNPIWTHSLSHWKRKYENWIDVSLPETVINFATFFDCRFLFGEAGLVEQLQTFLNEVLEAPLEKFFYFMAKNALQYEPPLTFFKNIKTFRVGHQEVFDIKRAMTPVVDMLRVYALKHRIFEANTGARLKALQKAGIFTDDELEELSQSYYFLMSIRLNNQAKQIIKDKTEPDNNIPYHSLTKIDQVTLKEVFKTIGSFQAKLRLNFTSNLLG